MGGIALTFFLEIGPKETSDVSSKLSGLSANGSRSSSSSWAMPIWTSRHSVLLSRVRMLNGLPG